jgi:hypothetical protein
MLPSIKEAGEVGELGRRAVFTDLAVPDERSAWRRAPLRILTPTAALGYTCRAMLFTANPAGSNNPGDIRAGGG